MSTYADKRAEYELLLAEGERRTKRASHRRRGGLLQFIRDYWHILEPEAKMVEGWPLEAICHHLEAITRKELDPPRLLMNVPPGFMKSLTTDVFWPAWEWGPMGLAHMRYVAFSYSASLTERDNRRFLDLTSSPEYQELYGGPWRTTEGKHIHGVMLAKIGERLVSNKRKGWKLATSVGGVGTGERGNRVILDDPHNVKEQESDVVRTETVRWFREAMSNRLNDAEHDAIIVIMQRVQEGDVSGEILSANMEYHHLMIPMEFDSDRVCETAAGWVDPRYDPDDLDECDGILAWPERFNPKVSGRMKHDVGPYAWAGQYQQAPAPRGGGIFRRDWWQLWEPANGKFPVFDYVFASLDSSYTEKEENDPSGLTVWGTFKHPDTGKRRIMLIHAWRKHLQFSGPRDEQKPKESYNAWVMRTQKDWGLIEWVRHTGLRFKIDRMLIEAKASGISAAQELGNRWKTVGFGIELCQVTGDKYARAIAVQPTFSQQMVYAPAREWSEMVIDEMGNFPKGKYKDLTDSATQAIKHLRDIGLADTDEEELIAATERVRHKPKKTALYPV